MDVKEEIGITDNGVLASGEIDIGRDLISLDLVYGEVVHILENPISTATVHIRGNLDDIGIGLHPGSRGDDETTHVLRKIMIGPQSPQRRHGLEMLSWML